MIVRTRYRDIPIEEAAKCCATVVNPNAAPWWKARRGNPVNISVPASNNVRADEWLCEGPWYEVVDDSSHRGEEFSACPHMAEIGD